MFTISQQVWSIISSDITAMQFLKLGLLNTSGYAKTILPKIQAKSLAKVSLGSIVTALARLKKDVILDEQKIPKFEIEDLSLKLPICELVYAKNKNPNPDLSEIYKSLEKNDSTHFNLVNIEDELDIFVSSQKVDLVKRQMKDFTILLEEVNLSALILKYDYKYRNFPGMGSQILNCLALRSISFVECLTTYSEFIIYIKQDLANQAIEVLKEEFMN